jgi:archaellum component FlaC
MKIFGKEFKTRKELKADINRLETNVLVLRTEYEIVKHELNAMKEVFPFAIGQTVYDVQLRNEHGRYAKKNISLEHSRINEVVVDTKNYFNLVERYERNDVFTDYEYARAFLEDLVVNK